MDLTSFLQSPLSLLAPIVAISLAVITRKTLISLMAGIIVGSLQLTDFQIADAVRYLFQAFLSVFWNEGPNTSSIFILLFLICLGVMTSFISLSGGTKAFGEWAKTRVKTAQGAQLLTVFLGILIFIDDYFNALAVGNISRPLTDRNGVSRAKLAYLIDSTAAPVCVITPISSWGAYIIALIAPILMSHGVTNVTAFSAFIEMIPMNLYAMVALAMVIASAAMDINIGPMKAHALRADKGELYDSRRGEPMGSAEVKDSDKGTVADLMVPVLVLVAATVTALMLTGAEVLSAAGQPFSVIGAFENTNVALSLLAGGVIGLICGLVMLLRHKLTASQVIRATLGGVHYMMGAIYILILAWVLIDVIGNLETGGYLASLVSGSVNPSWLPALIFLVSGIMAFATGTSWGAFGVMLPIAGDLAAATDIALIMPMMAAVLAGAVFGDHCSPISDTTILSSTGASCHHIDHVVTQLPYCLAAAGISFFGYLVMGMSGSVSEGILAAAVLFIITILIFRKISVSSRSQEQSIT